MASDRVELRVLGPLQVLVGGRQLVLTSPSQRALLAAYTATAWQTLALLRPGDHRLATANPDWTTNPLPLPFPDQQAALAWLETERANLLAAIDRTTQTAPAIPAELASQLTMALLGFFTVHGLWSDGAEGKPHRLVARPPYG